MFKLGKLKFKSRQAFVEYLACCRKSNLKPLVKLKFIGSGAYRQVYRLPNTQYVVKFGITDDPFCPGDRANRSEFRIYKGANTAIRRKLARVFELSKDNVVLLVQFIPGQKNADPWEIRKFCKSLPKHLRWDCDKHNIIRTPKGTLRLIDFAGYVFVPDSFF